MTAILLMVCLGAGNCTPDQGDFCDLALDMTTDSVPLAHKIVELDRNLAVNINTHEAQRAGCP